MEDKLNTFQHLSKTHRDLLKERNSYIYKIIISIISLEAAFIASLLSMKFNLNFTTEVFIAIAQGLLATITIIHLFLLHKANHINQTLAQQSEEICQKILNDEHTVYTIDPAKAKYKGCHMWIWQSSFVLLGILTAALIMFNI